MEIFGKRVKKELKEQGRTQTELADFLNVRKSTVSEWVNDNNEPPMEAIVETAIFLCVPPDYLLGWEDDTGAKQQKKKGGGRDCVPRLSVFLLFGLQVLPLLHAVPVDKAV